MEAQIIEEEELQSYIPEGVEICVTTSDLPPNFNGDGGIIEVETSSLDNVAVVVPPSAVAGPSNNSGTLSFSASTSAGRRMAAIPVVTVQQHQQSQAAVVKEPSVPKFYEDEEFLDEDEEDDGHLYECDKCGLLLTKKSTLDAHMEQVHVSEVYYACEFCAATAIHWSSYHLHQCTNMENKPLQCPHCHKTVSTKKQLTVHEEIHSLQRRFTTKKLDAYFARKLEEVEDPAVDWGAKPFVCGVCGRLFAKMYEVEYHEKLHSEEREPPNKCDKCGMYYINKNDLNKHVARGCGVPYSKKMIHKPDIE